MSDTKICFKRVVCQAVYVGFYFMKNTSVENQCFKPFLVIRRSKTKCLFEKEKQKSFLTIYLYQRPAAFGGLKGRNYFDYEKPITIILRVFLLWDRASICCNLSLLENSKSSLEN